MTQKFVEWRPELTPEDRQEVAEALGDFRQRVSLLKALRLELGLSQVELSEILETSQSNVSKLEAKADPRLSMIRKVIERKGGRLKIVAAFGDRELELPI